MNKTKILWWAGLIIAILTAVVTYCSCTAGITVGRSNAIEQHIINSADSTRMTFGLYPYTK